MSFGVTGFRRLSAGQSCNPSDVRLRYCHRYCGVAIYDDSTSKREIAMTPCKGCKTKAACKKAGKCKKKTGGKGYAR